MAFELGRQEPVRFSDAAERSLAAYRWPGNVRELKNVVERAVYRSDSPRVHEIDFDPFRSPFAPPPAPRKEVPQELPPGAAVCDDLMDAPFREAVEELKVRLVARAVTRARHNQRKAAELLGLTYHQFRGLYRKYRDRVN